MALAPELKYSSEQVDVTRLALKNLRSQTNTCDINIVCGEEKLPAHKLILRNGSAYFETMFSSGLQEASSSEIQFPTISSEVMAVILDFIYLQSVNVELMLSDEIWDLLSAAHLLQVNPLADICASQISKIISVDNWVITLIRAKKYSSDILVSAVVQHLAYHNLLEDKEVKGLDFECFSALVTASSKLKCQSMDVLIKVILIWVALNETDRKKHFLDLFSSIDFSSASGDLVASLINSNNLVKNSPELVYMLLTKVSVIFTDSATTKAVTSHPKLLVGLTKTLFSFDFTQSQWSKFDLPAGWKFVTNGSMIVTDNGIYFTANWVVSKYRDVTGIMAFYPYKNLFHKIIDCENMMRTDTPITSNLNDESGIAHLNNSLYVTGGSTPFFESYDVFLGAWRTHAKPILIRRHPKIVSVSDNIYVFGGYRGFIGDREYLNHFRSVEKYYISTGQWTIITMIPNIDLDLATFSVVPWQSKIYLSAGSGKRGEEAIKQCLLVYNPEENDWKEIMTDFKPQAGGVVNWISTRSDPPLPFLFVKQDNKYFHVDPDTQKCFSIVPGKGELVNEDMPENLTNSVIFA